MLAFVFSGQGAQFPGMMKDIVEKYTEARAIYEIADRTLRRDISGLCMNGAQEELNLTHNTQPCVLAADLAAYGAIVSEGIEPHAVAGFSLGEYAALVAAGSMDINDVFPLVQKRADYMQDAVPVGKGAMAAILRVSEEEVRSLCKEANGYVTPANYNCPGQIVVSGGNDAIDSVCEIAKSSKIRAVKLPVSAPFHCELMDPAAKKLKESLSSITLSAPKVPVYLNVDGKSESDPNCIKEKLIEQAKSAVMWERTIRNMASDGIDTFVELGPGNTLSGFVKKTFGDEFKTLNVTDLVSLENTLEYLRAGA